MFHVMIPFLLNLKEYKMPKLKPNNIATKVVEKVTDKVNPELNDDAQRLKDAALLEAQAKAEREAAKLQEELARKIAEEAQNGPNFLSKPSEALINKLESLKKSAIGQLDTNAPKMTEEQYGEFKKLCEDPDKRSLAYEKYADFTGSSQARDMSLISSFNGFVGCVAKYANTMSEEMIRQRQETDPNFEGDYPRTTLHEEGVLEFSKAISQGFCNEVTKSYDNGKGGFLSDLNILEFGSNMWDLLKIKGYFPGNPKLAMEIIASFETGMFNQVPELIASQGTLSSGLSVL